MPYTNELADPRLNALSNACRTPLIISGPVAEERSEIYGRYNNAVAQLHRKQTRIVNELVADAEKLLEEDKRQEAADKLLAAKRGAPKNKPAAEAFRRGGPASLRGTRHPIEFNAGRRRGFSRLP